MPNFARKGINESFAIREQEKIRVKGKRFKFEKMPTLSIKELLTPYTFLTSILYIIIALW